MISPQHSIITTIEGNVIDTTYVGELKIHTVLTDHYATLQCVAQPVACCSVLGSYCKNFRHCSNITGILYTLEEKSRFMQYGAIPKVVCSFILSGIRAGSFLFNIPTCHHTKTTASINDGLNATKFVMPAGIQGNLY